ncbi:MAG: protein-L-isoaspartate(D-aspartate) O-methyltransferase [Lentisphaerae bacterium]|nr:protein-L-isoaspartate(D-aspartate) O-methyltransferase [Lentisphaerota bacterium]MBT4817960.1 protein-L-isoaspartate(D-aspartate) O-methyltransferase [Lentisphaerota bacterium]MBT5611333.1 protein-L-isoaspartate(D-aspartate) O-methyltransferase [Lentisphaerota bacterium]MBT7058141.1 protein-L-isoaspartate(D-aspartate) O-methyltransferase [Lentisphaerota bacterium]MBT7848101.1 protein-L-isoaspartate(D-aspartate) O-methyltransferase [Lentisphaerota bacterium]
MDEGAAAGGLRNRMVDEQLAGRGVRDEDVLNAFRRVPRHRFCLPETPLRQAYADHPLPIGHGQTISQPLMVAEMTVALGLKRGHRVLEIGTGSGYQAAILAMLAGTVETVERIAALAETAGSLFRELGLTTINSHIHDGTLGWAASAPYDAIVVTAASPEIPPPLLDQLGDGGRLAIPVGSRGLQELIIAERHGPDIVYRHAGGCRFVPLLGQFGWPD